MPSLDDVKAGQTVRIKAIPDIDVATQALRMGLGVGEQVICVSKVPAGPTVIQQGGMELAIGKELCRRIEVETV